MYGDKTIGVVVPAYNEEKLIRRVIETMPDFVDKIIIVDDCSQDQTQAIVKSHAQCSHGNRDRASSLEEQKVISAVAEGYHGHPLKTLPNLRHKMTVPGQGRQDQIQVNSKQQATPLTGRVELISLPENQGVGGAIVEGYKWCRDHGIDIAVVMAGDAQMDPADLPALLDPIVAGEADYAKGNRLVSGEAWHMIPRVRYLGNAGLSLLTKIASGYWHVADSQTGYTAANLKVLKTLDLDRIYKRYGMPNDILVKLNVYNFRVRDVEIRPVYGNGEKSGIKPIRMIPGLAWFTFKLFIWRMVQKYVIRDFHPLIFFYLAGAFLSLLCLPLSVRLFYFWAINGHIPPINALAIIFCAITGLQLLLFAMWIDMEYNKHLR